MNTKQQLHIALSAALGLGVVALVLVIVLGLSGNLSPGVCIALLVSVFVYGALVLRRLQRTGRVA